MKRSFLIAIAVVVALVMWMLSGQLGSEDQTAAVAVTEEPAERAITRMKVQTQRKTSQTITREVVVQGQLAPVRVLHVRTETDGTIESIPASKGRQIATGDPIATVALDTREASLAVAKANRVQAANEYEATRKLQKQGLQSKVILESAVAKLEAAKAEVQFAELALAQTAINAPIDALLESIAVEIGDFVNRGDTVATLVDNSQLWVGGTVPQQNIADVQTGLSAEIETITGDTMTGTVRYISSRADNKTRSFLIEVLVENPPERVVTGVSAEIRIPVEKLQAQLISPAILALAADGTLGVKAVNDTNEVLFYPVTVVKTESNGAWVTGIPDNTNVITLGQGFVNAGEQVIAIPETEDNQDS